MIPRAKHLSPTQFLSSAILGTYLGIGGYWLAVYLLPAANDLIHVIKGAL